MEPSCFQSEASGGVIWHYRVVEVPCEGSRKQRRKKGNVESNVIERAALLEQQPEQKSTNWVSLEQKIEQRVLLV